MRRRSTIDDLGVRDRTQVEDVAAMTAQIHEHQRQIDLLAAKRRKKIVALRTRGVTLRILSEATGLSFQSVQKAIAPRGKDSAAAEG